MLVFAVQSLQSEVVISEFLAENDDGLADADGDRPDWIEVFNNGASAVDLAGWRLSDDAQSPAQWQFPAVTIGAGARLVVFASGKDRRDPGQELHTNFALQNSGGYLALSKPDGTIATAFNPYPAQRADISFGNGTLSDGQDLVVAASTGKYLIPSSDALGTTWTAPDFNDASWTAATSRVGYQTGGPRPGLPIAYWTFDDTTASAIAGGPDVTLTGAGYDASVPGAVGAGKSLHFTRASSDYATATLDVSETAFTSSFWFRTTQADTGMFSVASGNLGSGGHDRHIYLTGGNIAARTWSNETIASVGRNYADGQWHHVAHVFGGSVGGQKLFVDGVQVASGVKAASDFNWQSQIHIGFSNDALTAQFHEGEIDDVAIWSEALNSASIASLAAGAQPDDLAGFTPYIATNVQTPMRNVNASLYLRLPFSVNRATPLNSATLRVRYDDGFIAFIDGVEVARRNAPASPAYNSSATADRSSDDALEIETIDISAHAALLANGNHVFAIHALNDSPGSTEFLLNAELSAATLTQNEAIYFDSPTPGAPDVTGFAGFVADTVFTPKRGYVSAPQTITITCATPGATIAYTLDGSDPSPTNGTQVPAPNAATPPTATIGISSTRYIRAMAHQPGAGLRATNADTHTYLFTPQILTQSNTQAGYPVSWAGRAADYGMDPLVVNSTLPGYSVPDALASLPAISMTCPVADLFGVPSGIYYDTQLRGPSAERKVSIEWINPDGAPGWHVQCGTRIHGNSSRSHAFIPKHPLRLVFRGEYGYAKLRRDIFGGGVKKFDQLLLRGCSTDSMPVVDGNIDDGEQRWNNDKATYLRDQYLRDVLNDLGSPNSRGRYAHLFINGLYWGLYNIAERPTASFFADTFGGAKEEWDVIKDFVEVHDGNATAWNAMMTINNNTSLPYETRAQRLLGNDPDGTRNPAFEIYLHLPSFIDYMIVHIAAGAEDWPDHDWWAGRRRGPLSDGFHFVAWDQEISNDSLTRTSGRGSANPFESVGNPANQSIVDRNGPAGLYDTLRRAPTFQAMFRERVHALLFNNGPLSPAAQKARWALRQAEIDKAVVAESARWGDAAGESTKKRETTWLANMSYMNTPATGYWDAIFPIDVQRFRNVQLYPSINQPTMSQQGGVVPNGFQLYFSTDQPAAYYTLDGTDPMGANGQPSPSAQVYNGGIVTTNVIPQGASWRYLVTPSAPASTWKQIGFNDATWPEAPAQLGYGDGDEATVIGFGGNPSARYVTTYFRKKFTLSALPQTAKLHLLRDDGAVVYLNNKEVARSNMHPTNAITYSTFALTNVSGADESTNFYQFTLTPSDFVAGDNVLAVEVHKVSASEDDLSFDARIEVTASVPATPVTLTQSGTVKVRARSGSGEWSGVNSAYFTVASQPVSGSNVVVSELHYHPAPPTRASELAVSGDPDDFEFIELLNVSAGIVDFTGAFFSAGFDFHFPTGFALAPGARCVVVRNAAGFAARYGAGRNIAGAFENGTGLANGGETIQLSRTDGLATTALRTFGYDDLAPWPTVADGSGPSLVLKSPATNPDHSDAANWIASADPGGTPAESPAQQTFDRWSAAFSDALALLGDDDRDGIANALEYALVLNPLVRNSGALPSAQIMSDAGQSYLAMTFRHRPAADLTLAVETSADLATWTGIPDVVLVNSTDHFDGSFTSTWRCAIPANGARQFLRLRATLP
jgi:hypothetical protein